MSAPDPADPTAQLLTDLGSRLDPMWFVLALLLPVAIIVLWYGNREFRRWRGISQIEPRGRPGSGEWQPERNPAWDAIRRGLEQADPTAIASAKAGVVRVVGTIKRASGTLGGNPGRECVWRNRAGGTPRTAIAAELLVIADSTGRCGVENLEMARVTAPVDKHSMHYESVGLYIGDVVEIIGTFTPERTGESEDPAAIVYGTLGSTGPLHVRVTERHNRSSGSAKTDDP